jgi:two-component system nitrate/nitrite response regulator NarL
MAVVVVCDEHRLFGESFAGVLEERGAPAIVTSQPDDVVAVLRRMPVASVVLTVPPRPQGALGVVRRIRATWPDTYLLCLAAEAAEVSASCVEAGAHLVLSKRSSLEPLVDAVLRAVAGDPVRAHPRPPARLPRLAATDAYEEPLAVRFLTRRERDVLRLLVSAESTGAIANSLGISLTTVRGHIQSTFTKLGVHSRVEAVTYALLHSVVEPAPIRHRF